MEREVVKNQHHHSHNINNNITTSTTTSSSLRERRIVGEGSPDLVLRWGSRKRLRCMKIQVKTDSTPVIRTTVRVDRRVVRSDKNNNGGNHPTNGHFNLRQRPASPAHLPSRVLRGCANCFQSSKHPAAKLRQCLVYSTRALCGAPDTEATVHKHRACSPCECFMGCICDEPFLLWCLLHCRVDCLMCFSFKIL